MKNFKTNGQFPKLISHHAAVKDLDHAAGCDEGVKYDVLLHNGWHFAGLAVLSADSDLDHSSLRRTGFFKSGKDFLDAIPQRLTKFKEA